MPYLPLVTVSIIAIVTPIASGGSGKAEGFADGEWTDHRQAALAAATQRYNGLREFSHYWHHI
jgi:imidazole glycerol phosphate synthase subunit HisF